MYPKSDMHARRMVNGIKFKASLFVVICDVIIRQTETWGEIVTRKQEA